MALIDSYATANYGADQAIEDEHPSDSAQASAVGQALTTSTRYKVTSCKFYLDKDSAPTSDLIARIYASTGTMGTDAKPTGSALASSEAVDSSSLGAAKALATFTFLGINQIILSASTDYCLSVEASTANVDTTNKVNVGLDSSSPTHSGNKYAYVNGAYTTSSTNDTVFYLYGYLLHPIFNTAKKLFEKAFKTDATVTLKQLELGAQNGTTGWHALDYTNTGNIEMAILPKGQTFTTSPIGVYARYEHTGFTDSTVRIYDKIESAEGIEYRALSVQDYWVGDKFAFNVVELEKSMET